MASLRIDNTLLQARQYVTNIIKAQPKNIE